jgi:hypothetical protein
MPLVCTDARRGAGVEDMVPSGAGWLVHLWRLVDVIVDEDL